MKLFIALMLSISIHAVSATDISPKILSDIESSISLQKEDLNSKLRKLKIDDEFEGKIVAAMISTIENKISKAEKLLSQIDSDESLTEENVFKIEKILQESKTLIEGI